MSTFEKLEQYMTYSPPVTLAYGEENWSDPNFSRRDTAAVVSFRAAKSHAQMMSDVCTVMRCGWCL